MHMARQPKLPSEYTSFKAEVEKYGLKVIFNCTEGRWAASVISGKICIWHNDTTSYIIPVDKFWTSKAWKKLGLTNEKN